MTDNLTKKLKEQLKLLWVDARDDLIDGSAQPLKPSVEKYAKQIKQAFIDDDWRKLVIAEVKPFKNKGKPQTHLKGSDKSLVEAYRSDRMTGQEWYDRFEKEYLETWKGSKNPRETDAMVKTLKAAKKAAGIDT